MTTPPERGAAARREGHALARGIELRFGDGELGLCFFQRPSAHGAVLHEALGALHLQDDGVASSGGRVDGLLRIDARRRVRRVGSAPGEKASGRAITDEPGGRNRRRRLQRARNRRGDGERRPGGRHDLAADGPGARHGALRDRLRLDRQTLLGILAERDRRQLRFLDGRHHGGRLGSRLRRRGVAATARDCQAQHRDQNSRSHRCASPSGCCSAGRPPARAGPARARCRLPPRACGGARRSIGDSSR